MSQNRNPFNRSQQPSQGSSYVNSPPPPSPSTTNAVYNRATSRFNLRKTENAQRQHQLQSFLDESNTKEGFMARISPREMFLDKSRKMHKFWKFSIGGMFCASALSILMHVSHDPFWKIMPLTSTNQSLSMLSDEELKWLPPITPPVIRKTSLSQQQRIQEQRDAQQIESHLDEAPVPCVELHRTFTQCMSYDQTRRHLDQCMFPLTQYNRCLFQNRLSSSNVLPGKRLTGGLYLTNVNHADFNYRADSK